MYVTIMPMGRKALGNKELELELTFRSFYATCIFFSGQQNQYELQNIFLRVSAGTAPPPRRGHPTGFASSRLVKSSLKTMKCFMFLWYDLTIP